VNIPSANTAACSNVDQAAIEANKPAKNRIVGGLASVSRYAEANQRHRGPANFFRTADSGRAHRMRTAK
jgi:hypothetical protein